MVLAGDEGGDVGRHRLGRREAPVGLAVAVSSSGAGVGALETTFQWLGAVTRKVNGRLQVGLLEGGVDAAGVGDLELRVEVDPAVGRVDEAVQALAGARVGAVGGHHQLVVGGQAGQGDPVVGVRRRGVDLLAVERDRVDGRAVQVGERRGAGLAAGEADRGGRGEGRVTRRQVEIDDVRRDVQEGGAGGGLVPGQVGSRHARHHVTARSRGPTALSARDRVLQSCGWGSPLGREFREFHE